MEIRHKITMDYFCDSILFIWMPISKIKPKLNVGAVGLMNKCTLRVGIKHLIGNIVKTIQGLYKTRKHFKSVTATVT